MLKAFLAVFLFYLVLSGLVWIFQSTLKARWWVFNLDNFGEFIKRAAAVAFGLALIVSFIEWLIPQVAGLIRT